MLANRKTLNKKNAYKSVCLGLDVFLDTSLPSQRPAKFLWCPARLPAPAPMPNIQTPTSQTMSETRGDFTRANFYVALMIKEPRLEIIIISDKILIY